MSVVICYAADDVDIALAIRNILASRGIGIHMDRRTLRPGQEHEAGIAAVTADCSHVVLLLSEYSNGCGPLETCWQGKAPGQVILAVRIGKVPLPPGLRVNQTIPYSQLGLEGTVQALLRLLPRHSRCEANPHHWSALRPATLPPRQRRLGLRTVGYAGVRYSAGFALAGSLGGAVGAALARAAGIWPTNPVGLGMVVALGSAAVGAASFALAGAMGLVVAGEIIGEEVRARSGGTSALGTVIDMLIEGLGGALWGAACGLMVGGTAGVCAGWLGLAIGGVGGLIVAGAVGGAIAGAALGVIVRAVAARRSQTGNSGPRAG